MQQNISAFIQEAHAILPIIDIDTPELIIPTIEALIDGGINAVEITLRNAAGITAIEIARKHFPHLCIAAGTVTTDKHIQALTAHAINFIVSPGINRKLLLTCEQQGIDVLPGVVTPSEILLGLEFNLSYFKFFPAELCGGISMLKALHAPFPTLAFCATGGIHADNMKSYLDLNNVFSIGGSWIATKEDIEQHRWDRIKENAQKAMAHTSQAN